MDRQSDRQRGDPKGKLNRQIDKVVDDKFLADVNSLLCLSTNVISPR